MNRFLHGLETIAKDAGKVAEAAAPFALPLIPVVGPTAAKVFEEIPQGQIHPAVVAAVTQSIFGGSKLNPLEQLAITIIFGVLNSTIKNQAHAAVLKVQLLGVADDIYINFGMTPPARPQAGA